jgi:hypothetical protein
MQTHANHDVHQRQLDHRLSDIGWGLLMMLTGVIWLLPSADVPAGTWLVGVAVILLGINLVRYVKHVAINRFSLALGLTACVAAVSQTWRTDPPLVAIFLLVIGASLVVKPMLTRTP